MLMCIDKGGGGNIGLAVVDRTFLVLCTTAFLRLHLTDLVEDLGQLGAGQGAGEPVLAELGVLDVLADLGGGGEVEAGAGHVDGLLEEGQDDVAGGLGQGSGGQVADQTPVALLGLVGHDGGDHEVGLLLRHTLDGETLLAEGEVSAEGAKGSSLQEEATAKQHGSTSGGDESSGGGRGTQTSEGQGQAGADSLSGDGAQDGGGRVADGGNGGDGEVGLHGEHDEGRVFECEYEVYVLRKLQEM